MPCPACLSWKILPETRFQFPPHCNSISPMPEQIRRPKCNVISNRSQTHFHIQFSILLLISWISCQYSECRCTRDLFLEGSSAFSPRAVVLSTRLRVCAYIQVKVSLCCACLLSGGCAWQLIMVLACEAQSGTLSPDVTTDLHPAGGSSSTTKVKAGPLVVWGAEKAPCAPSGSICLAFNPPQMSPSVPALSCCAGAQNGAIVPACSAAIWHSQPGCHCGRFGYVVHCRSGAQLC